MKKLFVFIMTLACTISAMRAQVVTLRNDAFCIDHNKRMAIIGYTDVSDYCSKGLCIESVILDDVYTLEKAIDTPQTSQSYKAFDRNGVEYDFFISSIPMITINTDAAIVNTPAVHGLITVSNSNYPTITMDMGIKIRGTSSQQYDKKSYRIELWSDATGTLMMDTTFLGMRSDDDWNLEAMYNQPLRLRDKIGHELWQEMHPLSYADLEPEAISSIRMEYADVFINGSYCGVYALTERVDRKQLKLKRFNGEIRGQLYKGNGDGTPSFTSLPSYNNSSSTWDNYEWVYPNETEAPRDWSLLYSFVNFVMNSSDNTFYSQYQNLFEVDNAIDYFIFINVLKATDNMARNTFVAKYNKSGAYFYVPWDLDAILGLNSEAMPTSANDLKTNGFFDRLILDCDASGFVDMLRQRYNTLRNTLLSKASLMARIEQTYQDNQAKGIYQREHEAWPEYNVEESQLDYISNWLDGRLDYLDMVFNCDCGTWSTDEHETSIIHIYPNPATDVVTISTMSDSPITITITDCFGRIVKQKIVCSENVIVNIDDLSDGIYLVTQNDGTSQRHDKLIIAK